MFLMSNNFVFSQPHYGEYVGVSMIVTFAFGDPDAHVFVQILDLYHPNRNAGNVSMSLLNSDTDFDVTDKHVELFDVLLRGVIPDDEIDASVRSGTVAVRNEFYNVFRGRLLSLGAKILPVNVLPDSLDGDVVE